MEKKKTLKSDKKRYDDIIKLPHHTSPTRPRMSLHDRAAQFSPFAALTGHDAAIKETARLTDGFIELDEYEKLALDERMRDIQMHLAEQPEVTITYFEPDIRKEGGKYIKAAGRVKKIDEYEKCITMLDGSRILIDKIIKLDYKAESII